MISEKSEFRSSQINVVMSVYLLVKCYLILIIFEEVVANSREHLFTVLLTFLGNTQQISSMLRYNNYYCTNICKIDFDE
jgi:hypothetical protein